MELREKPGKVQKLLELSLRFRLAPLKHLACGLPDLRTSFLHGIPRSTFL